MAVARHITGTLAVCVVPACLDRAERHGLLPAAVPPESDLCVSRGQAGSLSAFVFDSKRDRQRTKSFKVVGGPVYPKGKRPA